MNEAPPFPRTLDVNQAAQYLGCSTKKIYAMIADQTIPPRLVIRLGKMIRLFEADLAAWHANGGSRDVAQNGGRK